MSVKSLLVTQRWQRGMYYLYLRTFDLFLYDLIKNRISQTFAIKNTNIKAYFIVFIFVGGSTYRIKHKRRVRVYE